MNSTGFWLTCLAWSCTLIVNVSGRPISSGQGRIRMSMWNWATEADDDGVTNVNVANDAYEPRPPPLGPAIGPRDGLPFFGDYEPGSSDKHCRYCEGEFDEELVDSMKSYGRIVLATTGVLTFLSLLFYALCSVCMCNHHPDCEKTKCSKPPTSGRGAV